MSPHCVWLGIVGGCTELEWRDVGRAVKKGFSTLITDTNKLIMIIELGKITVIMSSRLLLEECRILRG